MNAEVVNEVRASLGEGPFWHDGAIHWADILGKTLYRQRSGGLIEARTFGEYVSAVVPRKTGGFLLALRKEVAFLPDWNADLVRVSGFEDDKPNNRANDGKCDPMGRFWFGTMDMSISPQQGSLYVFEPGKPLEKKYGPVTVSNGLAWSTDARTMYYIDTPTQQIVAFEYAPESGNITNPRTLVEIDAKEGSPDGMTIDEDGRLWIALWGGSAVVCYDPKISSFVEKIALPTSHVSSCAFGGPGLEDLYVTTAKQGLSPVQLEAEPLAGALFRVKVGARGLPTSVCNA